MNEPVLERRIGRLLAAGTYVSVVALGGGVVAAVASAEGAIPETFAVTLLSLGLGLVILTPVARVAASAVGFAGRGERELTVISCAVLVVLGATVVVAAIAG